MSKKVIDNWLALATYDFDTAKHMLKTKRYLYVAFTCQQCIEKTLKAIYVSEKNETPPYIHNLTKLADLLSLKLSEEQYQFLGVLNAYYIGTRYADELSKLSRSLNNKNTATIFKQT